MPCRYGGPVACIVPGVVEDLRKHLAATGLIPPKSRILAALSGGPDSLCLAHLLQSLGHEVIAAHLDHQLRSGSAEEEQRLRGLAEEMGIGFLSGKADVRRISEVHGIGIEEAGRRARYEFLEAACDQMQCDLIATGHTKSDVLETQLLNLARGAGIGGLSSIPSQRGRIVRPLLIFSRAETRGHCEENSLPFFDDPMNEDETISRVLVRRQVVPALRKLNPSLEDAAARLAASAHEDDQLLNSMAAAQLEQAERPPNGPLAFLTLHLEVHLDASLLSSLPIALLRRSARLAASALGSEMNWRQSETVTQGLLAGSQGSVSTEGGRVEACWTQDMLEIRIADPPAPNKARVPGEGIFESPVFHWSFTLETAHPESLKQDDPLICHLNQEQITGDLHIRPAEVGDRMTPLGMQGTRLLSDIFQSMGLTTTARRVLPLVCDDEGVVWVPGGPLADRVRLEAPRDRALRLRFGTADG